MIMYISLHICCKIHDHLHIRMCYVKMTPWIIINGDQGLVVKESGEGLVKGLMITIVIGHVEK